MDGWMDGWMDRGLEGRWAGGREVILFIHTESFGGARKARTTVASRR